MFIFLVLGFINGRSYECDVDEFLCNRLESIPVFNKSQETKSLDLCGCSFYSNALKYKEILMLLPPKLSESQDRLAYKLFINPLDATVIGNGQFTFNDYTVGSYYSKGILKNNLHKPTGIITDCAKKLFSKYHFSFTIDDKSYFVNRFIYLFDEDKNKFISTDVSIANCFEPDRVVKFMSVFYQNILYLICILQNGYIYYTPVTAENLQQIENKLVFCPNWKCYSQLLFDESAHWFRRPYNFECFVYNNKIHLLISMPEIDSNFINNKSCRNFLIPLDISDNNQLNTTTTQGMHQSHQETQDILSLNTIVGSDIFSIIFSFKLKDKVYLAFMESISREELGSKYKLNYKFNPYGYCIIHKVCSLDNLSCNLQKSPIVFPMNENDRYFGENFNIWAMELGDSLVLLSYYGYSDYVNPVCYPLHSEKKYIYYSINSNIEKYVLNFKVNCPVSANKPAMVFASIFNGTEWSMIPDENNDFLKMDNVTPFNMNDERYYFLYHIYALFH